jgi:hypothetical protein
MDVISENDLQYKYSWHVYGDDDPEATGEPDSTELNREEGYEVLPFINKYCKRYGWKTLGSALKVEKMIKEKLPSDIHSREKIDTWIAKNW